MEHPKLINNISERVVDDIKGRLSKGTFVSIAAASFSIYAYEALKEELEQVEQLRFIFTSPAFIKDKSKKEKREFFIPKLNRERNLYGTDFELRLRNQLSQKAIAKECADWIRRKVQFRSNASQEQMGGFMHVNNETQRVYLPFNEFTTTQLGCERGANVYNVVNVLPSPTANAYLEIFNEQWNNDEKFEDVTKRILEYIDIVYQENAPEYVYFIALHNIFNEFLEDISEDVLPNERTGFKTSIIWNKLYNFQRDAALAIINKLEKYNGCILADSVGLGKTFTALAVIKYYENRNKSVLVLCPKKLNDNWQTFRANYKNNPVAADRLRYDILFHSDLSRDRGLSNGLDLEHVNWGNYDLIVIDESHNFRNGGNVDEEDEADFDMLVETDRHKENRYQRLMRRVIRQGVKTKVLMLSATPVNNRFGDLKNQLQLAYEGRVENINEALELDRNIDDIFKSAQTAYNRWAKLEPSERTTERLLSSWKIQCKLPPKTKRFCPLKTFNNAPLKSLDRWGYYYFSLFPSVCSHFTDTFSCQLNPVRRMYNTIHNGICYCRVSDCIIPIVRWQLRGDDDGLAPMSVLYYIEQDGSFLGIKVHKEEVIQYEQRAPFDSLEFRFQCAFYFCHLKRTHKFRSIRIICPYALLAGFIPHCCGKEALPGTG